MQKENQKICISFNLMAMLSSQDLQSIKEDARTDAIKKPVVFSLIFSEIGESVRKIAKGKKVTHVACKNITTFLFCDLRLFEKS